MLNGVICVDSFCFETKLDLRFSLWYPPAQFKQQRLVVQPTRERYGMKKLMAFAAVLMMGSIAGAGEKHAHWPKVSGVPVNELCDAGSSFKTTKPQKSCAVSEVVEASTTGDNYEPASYNCKSYVYSMATISKAHTAVECAKWSPTTEADIGMCLKWVEVRAIHATTYEVPVYQDLGEAGYMPVGSFKYTIPACR